MCVENKGGAGEPEATTVAHVGYTTALMGVCCITAYHIYRRIIERHLRSDRRGQEIRDYFSLLPSFWCHLSCCYLVAALVPTYAFASF
eukprot:COSAG05_NODE_517_length_9060_cov_7.019306_7_plen_88_part_00